MKIPKKLKIGGITYAVEQTKNLTMGNANYSGEIDYKECVIRVCPSNPQKMKADFCHEMIHAVLDHLGYTDHDEKKVDELGHALCMVFEDNPEMFKEEKS